MASHRWRKLRAIDLFAGCGGLTTGLKAAGFKVVAAVEFNAGAANAYKRNHRGVRVYQQDIRELDATKLLADVGLDVGGLDLLAGCPPCQGFSRIRTHNKGEAADDQRNELIFEYLRLVKELQPRALMFENVPGLQRDPRYVRLLDTIRGLGYQATDAVHDAADFGVPQRRRRLIMLAMHGKSVEMPSGSRARSTVREVLGSLGRPGETNDAAHDVTESRQPGVAALIAKVPHDGGSRHDLGKEHTLACHDRCDGFYDVYGRMRWDDVSPTITTGFVNPSKGRFLHPVQDRCITPREAALLQTFPADYSFPMGLGKYPVATMIGNAFPPRLAEAHAAAVAAALRTSAVR